MKTALMGILNITPDSFFASSRCTGITDALQAAKRMAAEGADIIDIGGESSRPGAIPVSEQEELERIIPAIKLIKEHLATPLSIDTTKPKVARQALEAGASLLNDISGLASKEMCEIAASFNVDVCVMHMHGSPQTMQIDPSYPKGVVNALLRWFEEKITNLTQAGIEEHRIILDPGIGFGKTVQDNITILNNLAQFKRFGLRLLIGNSRKSFMGKILNKPASELLSTTLAVNTIAILAGVDIIRVHDVREHRDVISVLARFKEESFSLDLS